jgi:hypothetical protein
MISGQSHTLERLVGLEPFWALRADFQLLPTIQLGSLTFIARDSEGNRQQNLKQPSASKVPPCVARPAVTRHRILIITTNPTTG